MKTTRFRRRLCVCLCMVLFAVTVLLAGCGGTDGQTPTDGGRSTLMYDSNEVIRLGEGSQQFDFHVVDKEGKITRFVISTQKTMVGEALQELNLINGDPGDYGLYVKAVNGIVADYDLDGTYWAFYVNGAYATAGVDTTPIRAGETYMFKVER